jgi:hypothetical protein
MLTCGDGELALLSVEACVGDNISKESVGRSQQMLLACFCEVHRGK